jgi:hypothetical protein
MGVSNVEGNSAKALSKGSSTATGHPFDAGDSPGVSDEGGIIVRLIYQHRDGLVERVPLSKGQ